MKRLSIAALAAVSLSTTVSFSTIAAQAQDAPSGTYALDPTHTTVIWSVSHGGFSLYRGSFDDVEGTLTWDADEPTGSALTVTIDANSVDSPAAGSHAGNDNFQQDIAKKALGAEDNPEITFTSTSLRRTGDDSGVVTGDLSFNGTTKPVEMDVTLIQAADFMGTPKMGFSGETTIDRAEWGSNAWTEFGIGTDVTISIQSEFAKTE
ncbi:MAG: YceI family protein [Pseudomonadota bacterium]